MKLLATLPAPNAELTRLARFASAGPGPGSGAMGNMIGFAARKPDRLSMSFGRSSGKNGQQQVVYSHTSTTALQTGSHTSGKMRCWPSAFARRAAWSRKMGQHADTLP